MNRINVLLIDEKDQNTSLENNNFSETPPHNSISLNTSADDKKRILKKYIKKKIKKETLAHVFSCKFCEISKNLFFTEHPWATASGSNRSTTRLTKIERSYHKQTSNNNRRCN